MRLKSIRHQFRVGVEIEQHGEFDQFGRAAARQIGSQALVEVCHPGTGCVQRGDR
jgi:hypothetical protein